jgi:hypothetical protein
MLEMTARIYRPSKTATQSGKAKSRRWVLEFPPEFAPHTDSLMGWTGTRDTRRQVRLWFASQEEAVAYAEKNGIVFLLEEPKPSSRKILSYSDNFKSTRIGQWTH